MWIVGNSVINLWVKKMSDTCNSFYLKAYRIHIYVDTLRAIGSPNRICFMLDNDFKNLAIIPYNKRDFKSHSVSDGVYNGSHCLEISSFPLCQLLMKRYNWDYNHSYRIIGRVGSINNGQKAVIFRLEEANQINNIQ